MKVPPPALRLAPPPAPLLPVEMDALLLLITALVDRAREAKANGHTTYVCPGGHEGAHCQFCDGGLFACSVCDSFEGATTSACPGRKMSGEEIDAVYQGRLDFQHGQWIQAPSRHCPSFYARTTEP